MEPYSFKHVALRLLPDLQALMSARRQARWQEQNASGEHKRAWQEVVGEQDRRIAELELQITGQLGTGRFRAKRELGP